MNILRLLLLAIIIVQPAAVPASEVVCAGPCPAASASRPGDAFAVDMQLSQPLAAVSAIITAECPLAPTFSDGSSAATGKAAPGDGAIVLPVQPLNGVQIQSRARKCISCAQGMSASCLSTFRPCGQYVPHFPPGGGFHDALLNFLATRCVPAFPAQAITAVTAYNHPALCVGFFIAEETRA